MEQQDKYFPEPIAVIGMSCRYPHNCTTKDEFWQLLVQGREGIGPIPPDRLGKGIISSNYRYKVANYLTIPIDEFDARFFETSPKTAEFMDPQLRLFMEVTWEALEDSFVNPQTLRGTNTGIFVGAWLQDYQKLGLLSPDKDFFAIYAGRSIASRLSFFLETTGPALDFDTACSSSMVAVDVACKSLRSGSSGMAIVGGVNLLVEPPYPTYLDVSFATSDDGRSKPFDQSANGYGRAEGCGVIILKRLSDAIENGDNILALLRGSAITQEGLSRSIGTPTIHCETLAMRLALKESGVDPADVSYIEAHGTGTKVGDPIEIQAIKKAYGSKKRQSLLIIGTVKANVGHSEACSGITSIIKVILSLQNSVIPKHINFTVLNPDINLNEIPAILPMENIDWTKDSQQKPRIAGASSFGISGTNVHVIIQEAPSVEPINQIKIEKQTSLMTISAKTENSLDKLIQHYKEYLEKTEEKFEDVAYSANTGRALFDHRVVLIASNCETALENLSKGNYFRKQVTSTDSGRGKICMLFPGQGSQYSGMARELYLCSPVFSLHFDECCKVLQEETNGTVRLKSIIWNERDEVLNKSVNSQIAIVCVNYCLFKLWESWGVKPDYVLGHSLGESAAVMALGIRDLRSGLRALLAKTRLVDGLGSGKMIALKAGQNDAEVLLTEFLSMGLDSEGAWLDIAAINSPEQTVLSGRSEVVEQFHLFCEEKGVKSVMIASSHAFHSRALDPALEGLKAELSKIHKIMRDEKDFNGPQPSIKYISSSEARLVKREELLTEKYWLDNTRNPVRFMDACKVAQEEGCSIFIEVGAQPILSTLVKLNQKFTTASNKEVICLPSLRKNRNDWEVILESVAQFLMTSRGNEIDWEGFEKPYGPRKKMSLPFYPFTKRSYWIDTSRLIRSQSAMMAQGQSHPLIGTEIMNATKVRIFQKEIVSVDQREDLGYLRDHKIGEHIIFPAAAFLEMCIASSGRTRSTQEALHPYLENSSIGVMLHNLRITYPLKLDTKVCSIMQVTVEPSSGETFILKVFGCQAGDNNIKNPKGKKEWIEHCSTIYDPGEGVTSAHRVLKYDLNDFMSSSSSTMESSENVKTFYDRDLPSVGLNFGQTFQTIDKVWRGKKENAVLVSIQLANSIGNCSSYFLHPLIGDAMIQATLFTSRDCVLSLPLAIKKVFVMKPLLQSDNGMCFALCRRIKGEDGLFDVDLLNKSGEVLAAMEGLQMVSTSLVNFEMRIGSKKQEEEELLPQFWEEQWQMCNLANDQSDFIGAEAKKVGKRDTWIIFASNNQVNEDILSVENMLERRTYTSRIVFTSGNIGGTQLKQEIFETLNEYASTLEGILYLNGLTREDHYCQRDMCEPLLYVSQWLQENISAMDSKISLKLAVITRGTQVVLLDTDVVYNPAPSTLWGMLKTLKNESPSIPLKCIDLPAKKSIESQVVDLSRELFQDQVWKDDQIAFRNADGDYEEVKRYVAKLVLVEHVKNDEANENDKSPIFKTRCSTYIVTGGLRGLGFQVASWMLQNGAKHLILVGRSKAKPEVEDTIRKWNLDGKKVNIFNADVGDPKKCNDLFDWIREREFPPVRGIIHCAGVLADGAALNQTWENFEIVFGPKVHGANLLHKHSLYYSLEHFVMFSSISANFGMKGQMNYAAGNCYEDALIRYRHSLGLPGTTVNWGSWEEVGMASNIKFPGMKSISVQQGLRSLEKILRTKRRQTTVATFSSFNEFSKLCSRTLSYVSEDELNSESVRSQQRPKSIVERDNKINFDDIWIQLEGAKERCEKVKVFEKCIGVVVKRLLGMNPAEAVDTDVEFHKLGIDSLTTLEVFSELKNVLGGRLTVTSTQIRDNQTVSALAEHLVDCLELNKKTDS